MMMLDSGLLFWATLYMQYDALSMVYSNITLDCVS